MLPLDLESLRRAVAAGDVFRYRFFWGHRARRDGALSDAVFSQWWPCAFVVDGQGYSSAEQFMMAEKARLFGDDATRAAIIGADDPAAVKKLGRRVRPFEEDRWAAAREALVARGNVAKFGADPRLRGYLLASAGEVLVEASPTDQVWGIGMVAADPRARDPQAWTGLSLLGFALMRARDALATDQL